MAVAWVITVSHNDRTGVIQVLGPYLNEGLAKEASMMLQSLPLFQLISATWEVHKVEACIQLTEPTLTT